MMQDLALLFVARALLRVCQPLRAHAILARIGSLLPELHTRDDVRRAWLALGRRGTCLSRSLAIAARAPTVDVVIAVTPRQNAPLFAHAWVEMDGTAIDPSEVVGSVIARLPRASASRTASAL
jgi:transglutaminase superfamily protein